MNRYASQTSVSVDRSRAEIEDLLKRYGATGFVYGWNEGKSILGFDMKDRRIQFTVPMPDKNDPTICKTPKGRERRNDAQRDMLYDQAVRQRWRALLLVIKAKLEAVEAGISIFEDEFLAATVMPDGRTVGVWLRPQLQAAYDKNKMPPMLPA